MNTTSGIVYILYYTILYHIIPYYAILCHIIPDSYYAILYLTLSTYYSIYYYYALCRVPCEVGGVAVWVAVFDLG